MAREVLYFEAPKGKRVFISKDNLPEWKTYTCTMSDDTKGIWFVLLIVHILYLVLIHKTCVVHAPIENFLLLNIPLY